MSERLDHLKEKFSHKTAYRAPVSDKEGRDYHPIFQDMSSMEIGEEIQDDVWNIVRVPGGYIVKRLNMGTVFVPEI